MAEGCGGVMGNDDDTAYGDLDRARDQRDANAGMGAIVRLEVLTREVREDVRSIRDHSVKQNGRLDALEREVLVRNALEDSRVERQKGALSNRTFWLGVATVIVVLVGALLSSGQVFA